MVPTFSLPFSYVLLLIFFLMLFVVTLYSAILIYHWQAYGKNKTIIVYTLTLYSIGVVILFGGMAVAIAEVF